VDQDQALCIDTAEIMEQLERILRSRSFQKAQRSQRLLRYLVQAGTTVPPTSVKEYTLALEVFDRDPSYDPGIDATVRVEASRLRGRLREYYDEEGRHDSLLIQLPKGGYALAFCGREGGAAVVQPAERNLGQDSVASGAGEAGSRGGRLRIPFLVVSLALGAAIFAWHHASNRATAPTTPTLAQAPAITLAILPIVNRSGDASLSILMDGLTDDMIRQLANVPALRLMAHASVFQYRAFEGDPREPGRNLGVATVQTGVLKWNSSHQLTLAIELTDSVTGTIILNREYLLDKSDLQAVQADLQGDLLAALHAEGSARDPGRTTRTVTSSAAAYQEFLQGDALAQRGSPGEIHQAIGHFEKATVLDPKFDLAWAALASAHVLLGLYMEAPRAHMPLAREYAMHALRLNPSLGEAHGSLGIIDLVYGWNPAAARAQLVSASAQQAAISTFSCAAHLIEQQGQPRTAEEMLLRMRTYDPQSSALTAELGCVDYYRGDYRTAIRYYREAIQADPHSPVPYWGLGKTLVALHRPEEALEVLRTFKVHSGNQPPLISSEIGYALGSMGRKREALGQAQSLAQAHQSTYVDPYLIAAIYDSVGDRSAVFEWLDKAIESRSPFLISLPTEHQWDELRSDTRFQRVVQRVLSGASP
jgi:TolB-like protein/Tfp pilus assembly protein PilF